MPFACWNCTRRRSEPMRAINRPVGWIRARALANCQAIHCRRSNCPAMAYHWQY
jgi:hypothetical protein